MTTETTGGSLTKDTEEVGGKTIGANTNISVAANKRKKISDGGNKNGAFNVSGLEPN